MAKCLGTCAQALRHFKITNVTNCCTSCHEDANEFWPDYQLMEIEVKRGYYEVCCKVDGIITDKQKKPTFIDGYTKVINEMPLAPRRKPATRSGAPSKKETT